MAETITNLDKEQNHQLQNLINNHNLDNTIATKTQKIYRQLRKMQISWPNYYSLDDMMRTSIVIAEKSQNIYTVTGQKIKAVGLALNQMIRSRINMKNIAIIIKNYVNHSKYLSEQIAQDLQFTSNQIIFGINFMQKFQRALGYFDFYVTKHQNQNYKTTFKSIIWSFFLLTAVKFKLSNIQTDYLLISVLYLMTRHGFQYIRPKTANKVTISNKQIITTILQKLFQIFFIQDIQRFKQIGAQVDDFFDYLINNQLLYCNYNKIDFLSPHLITTNLKKIDSLFLNQKQSHDLDYRLFFYDRTTNLTPIRKINKQTANVASKFTSKKVLDFQFESIPKEQPEIKKQIDYRLPSNVKISPSYLKTPLICAIQQSPGSSVITYMTRQIKSSKKTYILSNKQQILETIQNLLSKYIDSQKLLNQRVILCYNYFNSIASKYMDQQLLEDNQINYFQCSQLSISILFTIVPFVYSDDLIQSIRNQYENMKKCIDIQGYYLWLSSRFLQRQSDRLPGILKQSLSYLQKYAINQLSFTQQILQETYIIANNQQSVKYKQLNTFVQKLLSQTKTQIIRLIANLNIDQSLEQIEILAYQVVKYVLLEFPELVIGKCIAQLVLWSTMMILRIKSISIRFNDMISCYYEINQLRNSQYLRIINCNNEKTNQNIIEYYNSQFAKSIKGHVYNITPKYFDNLSQTFRRNIHERPPIYRNLSQERKRIAHVKNKSNQNIGRFKQLTKNDTFEKNQSTLHHKQNWVEPAQKRNQTTVRERPVMSLVNCLKTQKNKFIKEEFK